MPVDRWYKFQPKRNFKTLSLEEAEEQVTKYKTDSLIVTKCSLCQLKKQQKRENGRWMMLKRDSEQPEADVVRPNKLKISDTGESV